MDHWVHQISTRREGIAGHRLSVHPIASATALKWSVWCPTGRWMQAILDYCNKDEIKAVGGEVRIPQFLSLMLFVDDPNSAAEVSCGVWMLDLDVA